MKIRIRLYKVEIRERKKRRKLKTDPIEMIREIHEVEDLGLTPEVYDIDEKLDLKLVVQQLAQDNKATEVMVSKIHKPGEVFTMKVKLIVNE